jgi:hypothetical protein
MSGKGSPEKVSKTPGPGSYDNNNLSAVKDRNPNVDFSKVKGREDFNTKGSVDMGPGSYDLKLGSNAKSFTMRGRPKDASQDHIPGPG